jgi:hypothetical protein
MILDNFIHKHAAHCESGVISSILTNSGFEISEAMCFGISGSLTFAYFPFIKVNSLPLITYRMPPKHILKGVCNNLGAEFEIKTFGKNKKAATKALDEALSKGKLAGVQTSVYYLPYFPNDMRFHFNAHNLTIFKKEKDVYCVSDPVFDHINTIKEEDLLKARFAKGILAPKGVMYTLKSLPKNANFEKAIKKALKKTTCMMLKTPLPLVGVWGMRTVAKKLGSLKISNKDDLRHARLFVSHVIRMQEEIGTGGGGFRFMYASFLQESAHMLNKPALQEISQMMSDTGDKLRFFALTGAKMIKDKENLDVKMLEKIFFECADNEEKAYKALEKLNK